ncbi:hypothetical protein Pmi06nite_54790 [Planotetraspora mira]|uniref:Uncharacterized protein n=1 Tax=Planotetraspora mira TaxID=58121 RepID=A0A8J3TVE3_9ACTN|nr:hypothetical protein Pmi06nite_54790 [Planotetraspora mira]
MQSLTGLVPPGVVTVTWTGPAPLGAVAVICVPEFTVNEAVAEPNFIRAG